MVAKHARPHPYSGLAGQILTPLRRLKGHSPDEMAEKMEISVRAYRDFEKGRTGLLLERLQRFAETLALDLQAIQAAFHLRKPWIAHLFAQNKFMLIQVSAVDELDEETLAAIAEVDPLTVLDAHLQLYRQLAEHGRTQRQAKEGRRPPA